MDASSISRGTPFTKLQNVITVKGIRNEIKIQITDICSLHTVGLVLTTI